MTRTISIEIPARTRREFVITPTPDDPSREPWAIVSAINALDALDQYSVNEGYASYSGLEEPDGVLGTDKHGLWAVFTNTTIWAIPVESPTALRVREAPAAVRSKPVVSMSVSEHDPALYRLDVFGLCVIVTRNTESGQLIVNINSEDVSPADEDADGNPYIEVTINDVEVLDWPKEEELSA